MTGLFARLVWAIREWRQERKDIVLLRQYLAGKGGWKNYKDSASPYMYVLMMFLDQFAANETQEVKIRIHPLAAVFDPPIFNPVPTDFIMHWRWLLTDVALNALQAEKHLDLEMRQQNDGKANGLYVRVPCIPNQMRDALRKNPDIDLGIEYFMALSKTSFVNTPSQAS